MIRAVRPDFVIHENVVSLDPEVLRRILGDGWVVRSFRFCPSDLGIPGTRRRRYTLFSSHGRPCNPENSLQNFARVAFKRMECDARIYFHPSVEEQKGYLATLASPEGEFNLHAMCLRPPDLKQIRNFLKKRGGGFVRSASGYMYI